MSYETKTQYRKVAYENIITVSAKAFLIMFYDGIEHWFPKSLCSVKNDTGEWNGPGTLNAPKWLLDKNQINYLD